MIVMFGDNGVLILAITANDVDTLADGRTLTYLNPPHDPQLVRDIVIMAGKDKEDVICMIREAGIQNIHEETFEKYRRGERTDRPPKDN